MSVCCSAIALGVMMEWLVRRDGMVSSADWLLSRITCACRYRSVERAMLHPMRCVLHLQCLPFRVDLVFPLDSQVVVSQFGKPVIGIRFFMIIDTTSLNKWCERVPGTIIDCQLASNAWLPVPSHTTCSNWWCLIIMKT